MKIFRMTLLVIALLFFISNAFGGTFDDKMEQQTKAIKDQTEAIEDQTKAIEDLKWEAENEADDRALEDYDKVILEQQNAKIDAEIAEKDRIREEREKLLEAENSGDTNPEVLAEAKRRHEEDRQRVIEIYDLPSDIPYELAVKILVAQRGLDHTGETTHAEGKARVNKVVNDYKKSRGLPTSDEDYWLEHSLKTTIDYEMKLLEHHQITQKEFEEKKEWEFDNYKKYGVITTKEEEQNLRRWLDNYINKER